MLRENPKGNYKYVSPPGQPFSSGALADAGYEMVHAACSPLVALKDGYELIKRHLRDAGRPINAVCGIELRIPEPLTPAGFDQFNRGYLEQLAVWDVLIDRVNPIARTNVAPAISKITEPSLFGFYYTVPARSTGRRGFVLAGSAEVRIGSDGKRELVAAGDVSSEALRRKTLCVIENVGGLLGEMNLSWAACTGVNLYTVHDLVPLFDADLIPALDVASHRGITWHYSRPPIIGLELEIDCCAVREELVLP